jgi:hypothetical protein
VTRPPKRKVPGGGRPDGKSPVGGRPDAKSASKRTTPSADTSSRYTPPVPKIQKVSPRWVPVLMFVLLGLGAVVIFLNYVGLLPGATSNWYLLAGLGFILGGIVTATNFH